MTTTASPVRSRARWVWPIDAAASGSQSNSAKIASMSPSSASEHGGDALAGSGGTRFCSVASSAQTSVGSRSTRVAAIWPSLTYTPPASSSTRRRRTAWLVGGRLGRAGPERPEALPPGEADQLAVAAEARRCAADGAARAGRDDEAGPLADGQRAGTGQQVEGDGDGIVAGMPIATRCRTSPSAPQSQSLTPSATTIAMPQPSDAGEQRRAPPPAHAEQAQRRRS